MKVYTTTENGIKYGYEASNRIDDKGYEYRETDDHDWDPDKIRSEFILTLETAAMEEWGPYDEESLIKSYFAYEQHGYVPYDFLKKHLDSLVEDGHIIVQEILED